MTSDEPRISLLGTSALLFDAPGNTDLRTQQRIWAIAREAEHWPEIREAVPGMKLRAHFHNTRNTGYANAVAGLEHGASSLDASVGGLGGCPFAPRATGNIATEDLVYLLDRMGHPTGLDLDALLPIAGFLSDQLGYTVPALLPRAGSFPA